MIGKLLRKEETNTALVLALSGTIVVLAAGGNGPLTPGRVLARVLSNPVPRRVPKSTRESTASLSVPRTAVAA